MIQFIALCIFVSQLTTAQTSYKPIIDIDVLQSEAMERTVFITGYKSKSEYDETFNATGIILKNNFIITNRHVLKSHLEGSKVAYNFKVFKKGSSKLGEVVNLDSLKIINCDEQNDICLLSFKSPSPLKHFSLTPPPFRKLTAKEPLGLFKDETLHMLGKSGGAPNFLKLKYSHFTKNPYEGLSTTEDKKHAPSMIFTDENGDSVAKNGDSGGPIFDINLHLYGMVRDRVKKENKSYNVGIPVNIISSFVESSIRSEKFNELISIQSPKELVEIFK